MMNDVPSRPTLTRSNLERLQRLMAQFSWAARTDKVALLELRISNAQVVRDEDAPPDLVTMNSRVRYENLATGSTRVVELTWPGESLADDARVSILSSAGAALLGLREGELGEVATPEGRRLRVRVLKVLFQPESERNAPPPPPTHAA